MSNVFFVSKSSKRDQFNDDLSSAFKTLVIFLRDYATQFYRDDYNKPWNKHSYEPTNNEMSFIRVLNTSNDVGPDRPAGLSSTYGLNGCAQYDVGNALCLGEDLAPCALNIHDL